MKNLNKFSWLFVLGMVLLVAWPGYGCKKSSSTTAPAPVATATPTGGGASVAVVGTTFSPASVSITANQSVSWSNLIAGNHNVVQLDNISNCASNTSGGFTSGAPGTVDTYNHTFTTAGTYFYKCQVHCGGGMTGTVVVQ